jgi:3-methyladenine DNA glycosylase AlkD
MQKKLITEITKKGSPLKAKLAMRFFKTKKGEYGEGDKFIGVSVPEIRNIIKAYFLLSLEDLGLLIQNPWHEIRLAGLLILVHNYEKAKDENVRIEIINFYLEHREGINNWDLVDQTAYKILGDYCHREGDHNILQELISSDRHWDRRIAMVATLAFIRQHEFSPTLRFAHKVFQDQEDLMHKAAGWMLRELGKRDAKVLLDFIHQHGHRMPRTMLRYAIEKIPEKKRREILKRSKN